MSKFSTAEYHIMVNALAKPGADILASLTPFDIGTLRDYANVFCDAGDELDLVKKFIIYGKRDLGPRVHAGEDVPLENLNLTPEKMHALHMAIGIASEASELLDAVVSHVLYNTPFDEANANEEMGDLEFYMEGFRQFLLTTREAILKANIAKLEKRYASLSYSDQQAQARADKVEAA